MSAGEYEWERRERHRADALATRWFQLVGYVEEGARNTPGRSGAALRQVLAFIRKVEAEAPLELPEEAPKP